MDGAFDQCSAGNRLGASPRFVKRQQMHRALCGAHLLLQTRTKVLNYELEEIFLRWYPLMGGESGVTTGFLLLVAVMAFLYLRFWDRTPFVARIHKSFCTETHDTCFGTQYYQSE